MKIFIVTEKAMRPARAERECFYCRAPIGSEHLPDCILLSRKAIVHVEIDYEVEVPAHWDKHAVEFHRNESSWCASNIIGELEEVLADLKRRYGDDGGECMCGDAKTSLVKLGSDVFLKED